MKSKQKLNCKRFITLSNFSEAEIDEMLNYATAFKRDSGNQIFNSLHGKVMVLYFEKRSTRTRLSCTTAWAKLGGTVIDMSPADGKSHINVNESLYDSFRVISGMADCIVARVNDHQTLEEICRACDDTGKGTIVINGLSDQFHPLQVLADMMTIMEDVRGKYDKEEFIVSWIGDSNNVFNSLVTTLPRFGYTIKYSIPENYNLKDCVLEKMKTMTAEDQKRIICCKTPEEALEKSRYIITDTWVSMGDEKEKEARLQDFKNYQVNKELVDKANLNKEWRFLHCLPRKKEEVTDDIFYSERSLVFEEAENRMWTVMAIFYLFETGRIVFGQKKAV